MDAYVKKYLQENGSTYKQSLNRIIEKYSKLQYQDGGIEVDLDNINTQALERYMRRSKIQLNKLDSKSLSDLREESLTAWGITTNSQLDFTHQDGGADETSVSSSQFSGDDDGVARGNMTELTVRSLDESQRSFFENKLQPEDHDKQLEITLRSHGSSFVELYPSMISRIEKAWHRQNVSKAADSVLRRYRRWRQQSNRINFNNTFIVTLKHNTTKSRKITSKTKHISKKRQFITTNSAPCSPLHMATNLQILQVQQQSPQREMSSLRREQQQPILVMDFSGPSDTSKLREISLNETFIVSELSQLGERADSYTASPSRSYHPAAKGSVDLFLRPKRLSISAHLEQAAECSMYASEMTAVKERPDIYSSPVQQSPLKLRMISLNASPHNFSRSPRENAAESFSREPTSHKSMCTSLSSPPRKPFVPARMLCPQDSRHSPQRQLHSPQSESASAGRLRLRRQLSFDSSLPSYSPKKLDADFAKLYHKFVCQNKSSLFNSPPCRLCAGGSNSSRGHSSSALAALALSPHRSVLRKRHREFGWGGNPLSKRSRDECYTSSPGSKRHGNEMLSCCLSPSEPSHDDLPHSSSRHSASALLNKFTTQQRPADAHLGIWKRQAWPSWSTSEYSGLGGSFESRMAYGYSPR